MFKQLKQYSDKKKKRNLTKEREQRCLPLARKILEWTVERANEKNTLIVGLEAVDFNTQFDFYQPIVQNVIQYSKDNGLSGKDTDYAMRLALESIQASAELLNKTWKKTIDSVYDKLFQMAIGKSEASATVQDFDDILQRPARPGELMEEEIEEEEDTPPAVEEVEGKE